MKIEYTLTAEPKAMPAEEKLGFGKHFTDHMLRVEWDKNEGTMEHVEFIHRDLVISEMINRLRK